MPGPISDQYKGPKGTNPIVPSWMENGPIIRDTNSMLCSTCEKPISSPKLDKDAGGLEGYVAKNSPEPEMGWCSEECYEISMFRK